MRSMTWLSLRAAVCTTCCLTLLSPLCEYSSTEISSAVFHLLPPSLIAIEEMYSFDYVSSFAFAPRLTADSRDRSLAVGLGI
jgi:hypothetical protein